MKFARISGLGKLFDGLLVELKEGVNEHHGVVRFINPGAMLGDRTVSFQVPEGKILFHDDVLVECTDPCVREFSPTHDFGKFIREFSFSTGDLRISVSEHEQSFAVTVREVLKDESKTLFSHNFLTHADITRASHAVYSVISGQTDPDDLIALLRSV